MCSSTQHPRTFSSRVYLNVFFICIYSAIHLPSLSILQAYEVKAKATHASTSTPVPRPYFRVNDQCETGYEFCLQFKPVNCDQQFKSDNYRMKCKPSQAMQGINFCNERSLKYKMCDGAFEWCDGGAPVISVLRKISWFTKACVEDVIGKECDVRHRCFQQCLQERQSGKCNFFAIKADDCQTFSTLDGTGFSSSSCGPWKVYKMNCVDGLCGDVNTIASTAASTVKTEYSTTVSGLGVLRRSSSHTFIKNVFACILLCHVHLPSHEISPTLHAPG